MATRSNIAQLLPDDRVQVIYCHFDGYMSGVGRTLTKHYKTTDRVAELIALGDLVVLDQHLYPTGVHSDGAREPRVTVAFGRDRGDPNSQARTHASVDDWQDNLASDIEYCYLWRPDVSDPNKGKWHLVWSGSVTTMDTPSYGGAVSIR